MVVLCLFFTTVSAVEILAPSAARAETRSLKLYFTHTKERATITYKKNGRYVSSGLKKINYFLRDWRRDEPTRMDPRLLDLVWEVYRKSGSRQPIHVISGYRSPKTNSLLRRRGRKVARHSQHMLGKALDFYLPDVPVTKLRKLGLKAGVGGVGYYRGSFVHLDTGSVRHWPRMSRSQLAQIFPRGRTLHLPSDRKPMRGYQLAKADYAKRKRRGGTALALASSRKPRNQGLLARVFGNSERGEATPKSKAPAKPVARKKITPPAVAKPKRPTAIAALRNSNLPPELVTEPVAAEPQQVAINFIPRSLTVPKSKPAARSATALALAAALERGRINSEQAEAVRLAALTPPTNKPTGVDDIVSQRVRLALARARPLSPAEQATEAQANSALVAALARKNGVPTRKPESTPVLLAALPATPRATPQARPNIRFQPDRAESMAERLSAALRTTNRITQPSANPAKVTNPIATAAIAQARIDSNRFASAATPLADGQEELKRRLAKIASPKTAPRLAIDTTSENSNLLETPEELRMVKLASLQPVSAAPATLNTVHTQNMATKQKPPTGGQWPGSSRFGADKAFSLAALQLGNLDGARVNGWALSRSTRVGRQAQMRQPAFNLTMLSELPETVIASGFDRQFRFVRFDQFADHPEIEFGVSTHGK